MKKTVLSLMVIALLVFGFVSNSKVAINNGLDPFAHVGKVVYDDGPDPLGVSKFAFDTWPDPFSVVKVAFDELPDPHLSQNTIS